MGSSAIYKGRPALRKKYADFWLGGAFDLFPLFPIFGIAEYSFAPLEIRNFRVLLAPKLRRGRATRWKTDAPTSLFYRAFPTDISNFISSACAAVACFLQISEPITAIQANAKTGDAKKVGVKYLTVDLLSWRPRPAMREPFASIVPFHRVRLRGNENFATAIHHQNDLL